MDGTVKILEHIKKFSDKMVREQPDFKDKILPSVILSLVKEDLRNTADIKDIKAQLSDLLIPGGNDPGDYLEKAVLYETLFDEKLLYLKNLKTTLEKLGVTHMHQQMAKIAHEWLSPASEKAPEKQINDRRQMLVALEEVAEKYLYAESGKAERFLVTDSLKRLAREYENTTPAAVIMGAKGSGKTFTYLQLARLKKWSCFIERAEGKAGTTEDNYMLPLLAARKLSDDAGRIIEDCRKSLEDDSGKAFRFLQSSAVEDKIQREKKIICSDITRWKTFWLKLMAESVSCAGDPDNPDPDALVEAMQKRLDKRVVFLVDGLEDYFPNAGEDDNDGAAVRALCESVVKSFTGYPGNKVGLIIFARKDLVRSSIKQDFGQFENLYRDLQLTWEREEALRLAAWLVRLVPPLNNLFNLEQPLEKFSSEAIEKELEKLWGLKLGPAHSKEAYTAGWVIAALSDFNGQLQARDLVRLIFYAAKTAREKAGDRDYYPERLLPPAAIKKALTPCSVEKIAEIREEITILESIFKKLIDIPPGKKQVPFGLEALELTREEADIMGKLGIVTVDEDKYYMPEIIRRGLGFSLASRGRLKVLALLKQALEK